MSLLVCRGNVSLVSVSFVMVPCHSCHIHGIWRTKEVRRRFKAIIWGGNASDKWVGGGRKLSGEVGERFSLVNAAVLKLYCKSYWVLLNILWDNSFYYIATVLPALYLLRLARRPKVRSKIS